MSAARTTPKASRCHEEDEDDRDLSGQGEEAKTNKMKRHDVELPVAEADIKLAEKLDSCLQIGDTRKPRFFMNKPAARSPDDKRADIDMGTMKPKHLSREELRERLVKKYDTLVPELNPKRASVKLVKVLSAKESLELGKEEAKKQLVDQMKLNSIGGNRQAFINGTKSFRFNDGYEMPCKNFYSKRFDVFQKSKNGTAGLAHKEKEQADEGDAKTKRVNDGLAQAPQSHDKDAKNVKFADRVDVNEIVDESIPNPYDFFAPDEDDDSLTEDEDEDVDDDRDDDGDREESDYTTGDEGVKGT